ADKKKIVDSAIDPYRSYRKYYGTIRPERIKIPPCRDGSSQFESVAARNCLNEGNDNFENRDSHFKISDEMIRYVVEAKSEEKRVHSEDEQRKFGSDLDISII
ncbi:11129_t:CDS:2, partial [Acaulospora morrowiae]